MELADLLTGCPAVDGRQRQIFLFDSAPQLPPGPPLDPPGPPLVSSTEFNAV